MKNIFDLTKREQRLVIMIVAALVTAALAKHFWENRAQLPPARASSAKAATAAGSTSTQHLFQRFTLNYATVIAITST